MMQSDFAITDIEVLQSKDHADYDQFVKSHPDGSFFHLSGWTQIIESVLGHRCHFLVAKKAGLIVGVLPLVEVRTLLFGHALIGTGFTVGGGPLVHDEATLSLLLTEAERLRHRMALDRIELRSPIPERAGWQPQHGLYSGFVNELDPNIDGNRDRIRRKQRAEVRKAGQRGMTVCIERDVERFIPLYADSLHRLGTPMLSHNFFRALMEVFKDECDCLIMEYEGTAVAAVLSFYHGKTVLPYYAGSLPNARKLSAHDLMYFELMRHAIQTRECTHFDFGRSKEGTGSYNFKRHWGFVPQPQIHSHFLPFGQPLPEINPLNPKFQRKVQLWRKLPSQIVDRFGPMLARQIG